MRIEHDVRPVTYMKTKAAELLRSVAENRRPVIITQSGEPKGVLMDFASYIFPDVGSTISIPGLSFPSSRHPISWQRRSGILPSMPDFSLLSWQALWPLPRQ